MAMLKYTVDAANAMPRWANAEATRIDITVLFPHISTAPIRFTSAEMDMGCKHSEDIFARAKAGEFGTIAPYEPEQAPVPFDLRRLQFCREMRKRGLFSQAEAVGFVSSLAIPSVLQEIIDRLLTGDERDDATILILGAARIERDHPMTHMLAAGLGWSPPDTDDFFRTAAKL